jgi:hypothetical protein
MKLKFVFYKYIAFKAFHNIGDEWTTNVLFLLSSYKPHSEDVSGAAHSTTRHVLSKHSPMLRGGTTHTSFLCFTQLNLSDHLDRWLENNRLKEGRYSPHLPSTTTRNELRATEVIKPVSHILINFFCILNLGPVRLLRYWTALTDKLIRQVSRATFLALHVPSNQSVT